MRLSTRLLLLAALMSGAGCDAVDVGPSDQPQSVPPQVALSLSAQFASGTQVPLYRSATSTEFRPVVDTTLYYTRVPGCTFSWDGSAILTGTYSGTPGALPGSLVSFDLGTGEFEKLGDYDTNAIPESISQSQSGMVAFSRKQPGIFISWGIAVLDPSSSQLLVDEPNTELIVGWDSAGRIVSVSDRLAKVYWYDQTLTRVDSLTYDAQPLVDRAGPDWRIYSADLSHEGNAIVFDVRIPGSKYQIAVLDFDNATPTWLSREGSDSESLPVWGPNRDVYFVTYDGSWGTHFNSSVKKYNRSGNIISVVSDREIGAKRIFQVDVHW